MENKELLPKLTPEESNTQIGKIEPNQEINSSKEKDVSLRISEINTDISKKEQNIKETKNKIDDLRNSLGLPPSDEISPSIQLQKDSLGKLNQEKENVFELKLKENETDFDFLGRLSKFLVYKQDTQDDKNIPDASKQITRLLRKKNDQINYVYQNQDNEELIRKVFIEVTKSVDNREELNDNDNIKYLDNIRISSSSRNMDWDLNEKSENKERVNFFSKTNQERSFFPSIYKKDGAYYSGSLFNVHSNLPEAKEYLKQKLDGKSIYLLGGGKSIDDLLHGGYIEPKQIINIDPFISEEDIERNKKGLYMSISERADSKSLMEEIKSKNVDLADEIWASYSVPFYNESPEEVENLFSNIKGLLKEGGNCRITPISTQNEQSKQAMLNSLKTIVNSKEYNIHLFEDTLIIHKLEK